MSSGGGPKKFGLELKKPKSEGIATAKRPLVSGIFGDGSESDEEGAKEPAGKRFDDKYGSKAKKSDQRLMEKAMQEDPSVYEYDSIHEKLEAQRNKATVEQKKADLEKKPKYADNIINAHKKRQLDKLLHDERTYQKEREQEAGAFDDKEVFVTGAYRQQIEERNKFRVEQEKQDALDSMTRVEDQKLWQTAFQHRMLDMSTSTSRGIESLQEDQPRGISEVEPLQPVAEEIACPAMSTQPIPDEREQDLQEKRQKELPERDGGRVSERGRERGRERGGERESEREREAKKLDSRLAKIRMILQKRNGESKIKEAKLRYIERRDQGLIVPPLC